MSKVTNNQKTHHMENKLQKALELCNSQEFEKAETLLQQFLKEDPQNSEAWRVLAQVHWIHMRKPEKAYDELIEALRCNPKNMWALILMGNLLSKEHDDKEHAMEYFDKVLEYYPDNDVAVKGLACIGTFHDLYALRIVIIINLKFALDREFEAIAP